ncbi:hypothetical protein [Denitrobacterium detoxificans]|uniref:Flp pilus-assembly TadE/G-like n=1 Tax=Denitrobacterium detoxificans TaxID=79604 RepID=A0A1H8U3R1_9ACTN|nr:hypothetical protein [Denitrobacterium detoxificans]SEO97801.1 hypothetical protein SAMN02910314_01797 [Denitrobacterium detoxificans]
MMRDMASGARKRAFFCDDGGFSTLGMALALLITISLVLTSAQVYRLYSLSAETQNVADACALAAENQVATFYTAAQICDAVVLSLTLTSVAASGAGLVALCVPGAQEVGSKLIEVGEKVIRARDSFADQAAQGLSAIQEILPFLAAAQAMGVARANSHGEHANYLAVAVLLPQQGYEVTPGADFADEVMEYIGGQEEGIKENARKAEEAARKANESKERAFQADCGAAPGYCMQERADSLAGLSPGDNPLYHSVDTWSFGVALRRAQAYYPARLAQEHPGSPSVDDQANSALRARFYAYACSEISHGYVNEDASGAFDAYFPHLPANTDEMRETRLYTEQVYPVSQDGQGRLHMHAWSGCPCLAREESVGASSIQVMEACAYETCPVCRFHASSMGNVAAASTSTSNGFEHYYRIVEEESRTYREARQEYAQNADEVREPVQTALNGLGEMIMDMENKRISASPPGKYGVVAFVVDGSSVSADALMPNGFVGGGGSLGPRAALSAATLAREEDSGDQSVISSLFDGWVERMEGPLAGVLPQMASAWSHCLHAYARGYDELGQGVEALLGALPLVSASGLGQWASGALDDVLTEVGLHPADMAALKPVLVNSWQVANEDGSAFASRLLGAKEIVAQMPASAANPLDAAVQLSASYAEERIDGLDDTVQIASFDIGDDSIPVSITLPPAWRDGALESVGEARDALRSLPGVSGGSPPWE